MDLSDFGSIASIVSLIIGLVVGLVVGFGGCKYSNNSNTNQSSFKNIRAGGDVTGRDKK